MYKLFLLLYSNYFIQFIHFQLNIGYNLLRFVHVRYTFPMFSNCLLIKNDAYSCSPTVPFTSACATLTFRTRSHCKASRDTRSKEFVIIDLLVFKTNLFFSRRLLNFWNEPQNWGKNDPKVWQNQPNSKNIWQKLSV